MSQINKTKVEKLWKTGFGLISWRSFAEHRSALLSLSLLTSSILTKLLLSCTHCSRYFSPKLYSCEVLCQRHGSAHSVDGFAQVVISLFNLQNCLSLLVHCSLYCLYQTDSYSDCRGMTWPKPVGQLSCPSKQSVKCCGSALTCWVRCPLATSMSALRSWHSKPKRQKPWTKILSNTFEMYSNVKYKDVIVIIKSSTRLLQRIRASIQETLVEAALHNGPHLTKSKGSPQRRSPFFATVFSKLTPFQYTETLFWMDPNGSNLEHSRAPSIVYGRGRASKQHRFAFLPRDPRENQS